MYLTIRGLVLRVTDYKDKDAVITLLTEDLGRISVKARGLRRKNSPLVAPCQLLAFGEFGACRQHYLEMYVVAFVFVED